MKLPDYAAGGQASSVKWHAIATACMAAQRKRMGGDYSLDTESADKIRMHVFRPAENILYAKLSCPWKGSVGSDPQMVTTYYTLSTSYISNPFMDLEANASAALEARAKSMPKPSQSLGIKQPMYKQLSRLQKATVKKSKDCPAYMVQAAREDPGIGYEQSLHAVRNHLLANYPKSMPPKALSEHLKSASVGAEGLRKRAAQ